jgi:hypothetical protein
MPTLKKPALLIAFALLTLASFAQDNSSDVMRSNGKIYVVVAVVTTIMIGIFIYLLNLDRKISRIEKNK